MNGKLVCGVGIYTEGKHKAKENGKKTKAYQAWRNMLDRSYSSDYHASQPSYIGCTVCDEWLEFQAFAKWFYDNHPQDGEKYHLDKDIKVTGNKVYRPDACLFVPQSVNNFTIDRCAGRGNFMIGVGLHNQSGKLQSQCGNPFTRKHEYLGLFTDELQAHLAWRKRKSELAYELAMTQPNPEVRDALLRWKAALDNNEIHAV